MFQQELAPSHNDNCTNMMQYDDQDDITNLDFSVVWPDFKAT